jgi:hypothetical protein
MRASIITIDAMGLKAVLDPVGQFFHEQCDALVCECVLTLQPRALGDVFNRQKDLMDLSAGPMDPARVEHHGTPADGRKVMVDLKCFQRLISENDGL